MAEVGVFFRVGAGEEDFWFFREPVERFLQLDDFSDDEDGGGLKVLAFCFLLEVGEGAGDDFLVVVSGVLYGGDFCFGGVAFSKECVYDVGQVSNCHEEDEGVCFWDVYFPILFSVSSDDSDGRCVVAMSGWYSGVGGCGESGGNAGYDFEFYAGLFAGGGFFSASAKEVRVAAFQAEDDFVSLCFFDYKGVYFFLRHGVFFCGFSDGDDLGVWFCEGKQFVRDEIVVEDDVGGGDEPEGLYCDESGVSGACTGEIDFCIEHVLFH